MATPIGNLADLSLRAIHVLARADVVACEDTRVGGALLRHLGLDKTLLAVHHHNEREGAQRVLARLACGECVAFISDAGTPAVSDPGAALVAAAVTAGYRVVPIPGASAALAALSVAGDVGATSFTFIGFLPSKGQERADAVARVAQATQTQILFEAPHRIADLLDTLALCAATRWLTLARELTKQFETIVSMSASKAPAWLAEQAQRSRGEFVVVLHACKPVPESGMLSEAAQRTLQVLLAELPLKQAVALAATLTGAPRNLLYQSALDMRRNE